MASSLHKSLRTELAEALVGSSEFSTEFLQMCELTEDERRFLLGNERAQEKVLSTIHFILKSKGGVNTEPHLSIVLECLSLLTNAESIALIESPEAITKFVASYTRQLVKISAFSPHISMLVLPSFLPFFKVLFDPSRLDSLLPITMGVLDALGDELFALNSAEEAEALARPLIPLATRSSDVLQPNTLRVLAGLARTTVCPVDLAKELYKLATNDTVLTSAYEHCLRLSVSCALKLPDIISEVYGSLEEALHVADAKSREKGMEQDANRIAKAALESLVDLYRANPRAVYGAVDLVMAFVFETAIATEDAAAATCELVSITPANAQKAIGNALPKYLSSRSSDSGKTPLVFLSSLASRVKDQKVVDFIVSGLSNAIPYPLTSFDGYTIEHLAKIAMSVPGTAPGILSLLATLFKRSVCEMDPSAPFFDDVIAEIPVHLEKLAKSLKNQGTMCNEACTRLLTTFQQLGQGIAPVQGIQLFNLPTVKAMGMLLPALAELSSSVDIQTILHPDGVTRGLFRSVWMYCVLLDFVSKGKTSVDWKTAATKLALHVPVLALYGRHILMQIEKEMDTFLKTFDTKGYVKASLSKHLPGCATYIRSLPLHQTAYLLCVYYLEILRSHNGEFHSLFSYIEDPTLQDNDIPYINYFSSIFRAIADESFVELLSGFTQKKANGSLDSNAVAGAAQFLLINYCHLSEPVRKAADEYISKIVGVFPQVLWSKQCLDTLMELLHFTAESLNSGPLAFTHFQLSGTDYSIDIPEDKNAVEGLFKNVVELCKKWISKALKLAPTETTSILQDFMRKLSETTQALAKRHVGVSLAAEVVSSEADIIRLEDKFPACYSSGATKFITSLANKSHFIGEVEGMVHLLQGSEPSVLKCDILARLGKVMIANLDKTLQPAAKDSSSSWIDRPDFPTAMFRACALLVSQPELPASSKEELLSRIVWTPVRMFTVESMEVGVSSWSWILAACSSMSDRLMSAMYLAWSWTIDMRLGLFTDAEKPISPLCSPEKVDEDEEAVRQRIRKNNHQPHRIWIKFISEILITVENGESVGTEMIFKMLYKACADPLLLSVLYPSLGTRFHMLLLAADLARSLRARSGGSRSSAQQITDALFVDRIHACALSWFSHYPSWYEPSSRPELLEDVSILLQFCERLSPVPRTFNAKALSSRASVRSAGSNSSLVTPTLSLNGEEVKTFTAAPSPALDLESLDRRKRANLIILFVGNELERISVWNNPLNKHSNQIPSVLNYAYENLPKEVRMQWKDYIEVAWSIKPELAVMIWVRFHDPSIHKLVSAKVLANPAEVASCPQAISLLVTEENVKKDIPQLKHLRYWAITDPPNALALLKGCYLSHPLVTQYALRVLQQFTAETIIFYIPQLMQCLRYDRSGLVADYLVKAARKSELLAHQIIWNARTYPKAQEGEPALVGQHQEFADKVDKVKQRVIDGFTAEEKERYDQEMGFFDQFTAISGRLKPVDAKQRKAKLKEELRAVDCSGQSLYMPFNPSMIVKAVDAENPTVLRSAAKVPIMVQFRTANRDKGPKAPEEMTKCIFKSGDDTRQDMLAVQIIELFKRVFESAGLDLFLFPYKIIATAPDCGMIEVVPNSSSRDQVGQKTESSLYDYFLSKYGNRQSTPFQQARNNFLKSMAAYAVVSYLLQIKDRHNGNILITDHGHLVHIDFGFLFDISPGGDIGFEKSPFKLTEEMIEIMGGLSADQFIWFMEQGIKAFLAVRQYKEAVTTLVELMLDTQLPCFKPVTMDNLHSRFSPGVGVSAAAKAMGSTMAQAFSVKGTLFTFIYDKFQQYDNGIAM